jgi:hypothetical protein
MIVDVPSPSDFTESGLALLNCAWEPVISLLLDLDESAYFGVIPKKDETDRFWEAAKQTLSTALAIAQQGIEFVIKGKIADTSPYLLIAGNPREWPRHCSSQDTAFADFKTLDAQDLLIVYNTVAETRFGCDFATKYEELRRKRNSLMHTIDKRIQLHAIEVITEILSVHKYLFPGDSWINVRREFLELSPLSELHSSDWVEPRVIREFSLITEVLKPSEMKEFFGCNKKQRRYICPECHYASGDAEIYPKTALLKPNKSTSRILYCYVCGKDMEVTRDKCKSGDCQGNVISVEYEICTSCGDGQ